MSGNKEPIFYSPLAAPLYAPTDNLSSIISTQTLTPNAKISLHEALKEMLKGPGVSNSYELIFNLPTIFLKTGRPIAACLNSNWLWGKTRTLPYELPWGTFGPPILEKTGTKRPDGQEEWTLDALYDLESDWVFQGKRDEGKNKAILNLKNLMDQFEKTGNVDIAFFKEIFPEKSSFSDRAFQEWQSIREEWKQLPILDSDDELRWGSLERKVPPKTVKFEEYPRPFPLIHVEKYVLSALSEPSDFIKESSDFITKYFPCIPKIEKTPNLEAISNVVLDYLNKDYVTDFMCALGSTTWGYYVTGTARRTSVNIVEVTVETIGYRINDSYDFKEKQSLGYWDNNGCVSLIMPKPLSTKLTNFSFQQFRDYAISTLNPALKNYALNNNQPLYELKCEDFHVVTEVSEIPIAFSDLEKKKWHLPIAN